MMWDLGGGAYVPPDAYTPQQPQPGYPPPYPPTRHSSYPPLSPTAPGMSPFMPIGAPTPAVLSSYSPYAPSSAPTPSAPVQSYLPHSYSYAHGHSAAGGYEEGVGGFRSETRGGAPVVIQVHHHSHGSRRHSHSGTRPPKHSNASKPNKLHHSSHSQEPSSKHKLKPPSAQSGGEASPHRNHFHYSRCTGKRKALCIGINYHGTQYELKGCINDARNVQRYLIRNHNFRSEDIILLTDSSSSSSRQLPTRQNILDAMHWLVRDACPDDSLFFHYSGHGSQVKDKDGDEVDGYDEVIFPLDYQKASYIDDDLMHTIMVKPLPSGCRLTALFDSCHSGSVLDLPYLYHTNGRVKGSQVTPSHHKKKSTPADVISWSGCKDDQTSADTFEAGAATGAMSYAFMTSLKQNPQQTYQDLLRSVRSILHDKYSQKPQLSSSHRIDISLKFII